MNGFRFGEAEKGVHRLFCVSESVYQRRSRLPGGAITRSSTANDTTSSGLVEPPMLVEADSSVSCTAIH